MSAPVTYLPRAGGIDNAQLARAFADQQQRDKGRLRAAPVLALVPAAAAPASPVVPPSGQPDDPGPEAGTGADEHPGFGERADAGCMLGWVLIWCSVAVSGVIGLVIGARLR